MGSSTSAPTNYNSDNEDEPDPWNELQAMDDATPTGQTPLMHPSGGAAAASAEGGTAGASALGTQGSGGAGVAAGSGPLGGSALGLTAPIGVLDAGAGAAAAVMLMAADAVNAEVSAVLLGAAYPERAVQLTDDRSMGRLARCSLLPNLAVVGGPLEVVQPCDVLDVAADTDLATGPPGHHSSSSSSSSAAAGKRRQSMPAAFGHYCATGGWGVLWAPRLPDKEVVLFRAKPDEVAVNPYGASTAPSTSPLGKSAGSLGAAAGGGPAPALSSSGGEIGVPARYVVRLLKNGEVATRAGTARSYKLNLFSMAEATRMAPVDVQHESVLEVHRLPSIALIPAATGFVFRRTTARLTDRAERPYSLFYSPWTHQVVYRDEAGALQVAFDCVTSFQHLNHSGSVQGAWLTDEQAFVVKHRRTDGQWNVVTSDAFPFINIQRRELLPATDGEHVRINGKLYTGVPFFQDDVADDTASFASIPSVTSAGASASAISEDDTSKVFEPVSEDNPYSADPLVPGTDLFPNITVYDADDGIRVPAVVLEDDAVVVLPGGTYIPAKVSFSDSLYMCGKTFFVGPVPHGLSIKYPVPNRIVDKHIQGTTQPPAAEAEDE